jgi:hypothetical protein
MDETLNFTETCRFQFAVSNRPTILFALIDQSGASVGHFFVALRLR